MGRFSRVILRAEYEALYFSGASHVMRPVYGGVGAILSLNRGCAPFDDYLQPSWKLAVRPQFLERMIVYFRRRRIEIVSPDEVWRRLTERDFRRRFVCLTLDGAYREHYERAWPIFKKQGAPVTFFVPTGFPDRNAVLWWLAVAEIVAKNTSVIIVGDDGEQRVDCASEPDKRYFYDGLIRWLLSRERDEDIGAFVRDLAARYDVDIAELRERVCMTWDQIGALARDPLVTIGAQSVSHPVMTKLSRQRTERELRMSRAVIESAIGTAPRHFAYPFGQPEMAGAREFQIATDLGYLTAMTTQPGVLTRAHGDRLTALPRIALDGSFQRLRYLQVAMSGVPQALAARLSRVPSTSRKSAASRE